MKKRFVIANLLIASTFIISGCSNNGGLNIEFDDIIPTAYVGEEYDFTDVLIVENNVKYHLDVYYYNYYEKVEKTLEVRDDFYFTPTEEFDLSIIVSAKKSGASGKKVISIPVVQKADPIDELLATGGYGGWADTGISKEIVTNEQYLHGENSHTALAVHFQGGFSYPWGTSFLALNNFRFLPYWDDQTWENAVVHFWVINPTDKPLVFQLRVFDQYTGLVNVDWNQDLSVPVTIAAESAGEVAFSLAHLGVNHTLFANEEGTRNDSINVKVKWGETTSGDEIYTYQFFVDDVNVTPYSKARFPDLDTKCYAKAETLLYGWENMYLDDGWSTSKVLFDREVVNNSAEHPSLSSMFLTFNGITPNSNGYSVILNPEAEFGIDDVPSFSHGTLDFDVLFSSNITNKQIKIVAVNKTGEVWDLVPSFIVTPTGDASKWMHVSIDFTEHPEFKNVIHGVRLGFGFEGIDDGNKDEETTSIHLDNIIFEQNGGVPEGYTPFSPSGLSIDIESPIPVSTGTLILDVKFTSASDTYFNVMFGDGWENWFGYYQINADGTLEDEYVGLSITSIPNDCYRITVTLSQLNLVGGGSIGNINNISLMFIRGDYTTATGYCSVYQAA